VQHCKFAKFTGTGSIAQTSIYSFIEAAKHKTKTYTYTLGMSCDYNNLVD